VTGGMSDRIDSHHWSEVIGSPVIAWPVVWVTAHMVRGHWIDGHHWSGGMGTSGIFHFLLNFFFISI